MSVFGGDSWAREAQFRKRRVDDLLVEALDPSSYTKLPSGKFACLICPHNPVLDSSLMLSMHCKGSRHRSAMTRLKERELVRKDEMDKRIALSESTIRTSSGTSTSNGRKSKPLIEQTRKATSVLLGKRDIKHDVHNGCRNPKSSRIECDNETPNPVENFSFAPRISMEKAVVSPQMDIRERRERELKFTAAGWKRDGNGKWFKDENVEFDSDEEDPNVSLA